MIGAAWILVVAAIAALVAGIRMGGVLLPSISVGAAIAAGIALVAGLLRRPPDPSPDAAELPDHPDRPPSTPGG